MWISLPISAGAMFLLGLPLVLALRACGLLIAGVVWSAAVSIGAVAMLTIYWIDGTGIGLEAFWFGEGCGAFAGLVFVLAAGIPWRRARA
jgi:hypothetical protein